MNGTTGTALLSIAIAPKTAGDAQKLAQALQQLIAEDPALHVRLTAAPGGELSGIAVNGLSVENFAALQGRVVALVASERGPSAATDLPEVELDCDSELGYGHVIDAVSAVSGKVGSDGHTI